MSDMVGISHTNPGFVTDKCDSLSHAETPALAIPTSEQKSSLKLSKQATHLI